MGNGLFITGTDTGVGKTRVGVALAQGLRARGVDVRVRKPVESGCIEVDGERMPQDAIALREAAGCGEPLARVCAFRLRAPLSPERAAALEGIALSPDAVVDACLRGAQDGFLLVEGAGGVLSPVADGALNVDLASALGLPVLVVAADRLGTINHTLLACEALGRRGLAIAGVVLSTPDANAASARGMDNAGDLARWLGRPVHRLPHGDAVNPDSAAIDAVHLRTLLESLVPRPDHPA